MGGDPAEEGGAAIFDGFVKNPPVSRERFLLCRPNIEFLRVHHL